MQIGSQRPVNPEAIAVPDGYRVEALVTGLSFPSSISFGPGGELYLSERGGVGGLQVSVPRVLRIDPDRSVNEIGRLENPIVGVVYRSGELLIGEDGDAPRILRVTAEGELKILVDSLPGGGDHGLGGLALDRTGALLFGLGTRTNSGVVGLDNAARGWVARNPDRFDVPGADVELAGVNYVTTLPTARGQARATTGSFKAFGQRSEAGESLRGVTLCGGAVYRLGFDGSEPERVAWGLRSPLGVAGSPDGHIWATDGGMEERGSRPIAGAPDTLWDLQPNSYCGWPDFAAGVAVTDARFRLPGHPAPRRLFARAPKSAGNPVAAFPARSGAAGLAFAVSDAFGFGGDAFVALAGPWSLPAYPEGENAPAFRVVRVNPRSGEVSDFMFNRQVGPASASNSGGLERPFDVRFDPGGEALYVVDLGEVHLSRESGVEPFGCTGVIWRITRVRPLIAVPDRPRADAPANDPMPETSAGLDAAPETPEEPETDGDHEALPDPLAGFDLGPLAAEAEPDGAATPAPAPEEVNSDEDEPAVDGPDNAEPRENED